MTDIKGDAWRKFVDTMDFESDDQNFKIGFDKITNKFGQAYIEYCRAAWQANDGIQSEDEFRKMNANMPKGFFENVIKR